MRKDTIGTLLACLPLLLFLCAAVPEGVSADVTNSTPTPFLETWWLWPAGFFMISFGLGILSVLGGVGGGLLYLALITAFFSIHVDFVRINALLLALTSALVASPGLLRRDLASLRLGLPVALLSVAGALFGSYIGLRLSPSTLHLCLGVTIVLSAGHFIFQRNIRRPSDIVQDRLSAVLGLGGWYRDDPTKENATWAAHRTLPALTLFFLAGTITGALGLETGWASVALYNLVMGIPLKLAVGTAKFLSVFTAGSAAWIYFNHGCFIALLAVPSILGLITGSFAAIELHSLVASRVRVFRLAAVALLILCGIRIFIKGIWL